MKKRNDKILLVSIIILALVMTFFLWGRVGERGMTVAVTVDGREVGRYSLMQNREISIGDTNVLQIADGMVDMIFARCPDQVCVNHSSISKSGETIICLPNKVVVTIEGVTDERSSDVNGTSANDEIDIMVK